MFIGAPIVQWHPKVAVKGDFFLMVKVRKFSDQVI